MYTFPLGDPGAGALQNAECQPPAGEFGPPRGTGAYVYHMTPSLTRLLGRSALCGAGYSANKWMLHGMSQEKMQPVEIKSSKS